MRKTLGFLLILVGLAGILTANPPPRQQVPEIDPASGVSALVLLAGALVVLRSTRKR
jgi:hypothetical protein